MTLQPGRTLLPCVGSFRGLSLLVQSTDPSQPGWLLRQSSPMGSPGVRLIVLPLLSPSITALEDRTHFFVHLAQEPSLECQGCFDGCQDALAVIFYLSVPLHRLVFLRLPFSLCVVSHLPSPELGRCSSLEPAWPPQLALAIPGGSLLLSSPMLEFLSTDMVVFGRQLWISSPHSLSHKLSSAFPGAGEQQ